MDPFHRLSPSALRAGLFASLLATLGCFLIIAATNQPLETPAAPLGILSLQFAGGSAAAAEILNSWGETERLYAAFNLGFDYLYLACYALFLSLSCAALARARRHDTPGFATAGFLLAWAMFAAAGFDMVENVALWQLLLGSPDAYWPKLATTCAVLKFGIILAGVGYIIIGLLALLGNARR
ncbi:MAG: hypothetical protein EA420_01245 [Candidatus Competibacteraceae bacterium]|nr:MAG: hypothetical protein EA420_01245 [Candidatus Competibacteraceae bacterium]